MMDEQELIRRLEECGRVVLCLPGPRLVQGVVLSRFIAESEGAAEWRRNIRQPKDAIDRANQVLDWLPLMPKDRPVLSRIIVARMLTCPITGRHIHSWRSIARLCGADHKAVQRWHADGLRILCERVNAALAAPAQRLAA